MNAITVKIHDRNETLTILEAITLRNELTKQINQAQSPIAERVNFFPPPQQEKVNSNY